FIVGGSHTVERWVEVGAFWVHAFVSLFGRQGNTATLQVNVNDLDVQNFVDRDNLFSGVDVTVSQFGNVNQTFDTIFYANKCTEWHQLGDLARYNLAQGVGACKDLPWVFLCCLER